MIRSTFLQKFSSMCKERIYLNIITPYVKTYLKEKKSLRNLKKEDTLPKQNENDYPRYTEKKLTPAMNVWKLNILDSLLYKKRESVFSDQLKTQMIHLKADALPIDLVPVNNIMSTQMVNVNNLIFSGEKNDQPHVEAGDYIDSVLILDETNFEEAVSEYELLLIMFHAPWCLHCTEMKPRFFRAGRELPEGNGQLALCDAEESPKLALHYDVYQYPTIKLFRNGQYVEDYLGPRRSLNIIKYMIQQAELV